jgi:hypothetical protein
LTTSENGFHVFRAVSDLKGRLGFEEGAEIEGELFGLAGDVFSQELWL